MSFNLQKAKFIKAIKMNPRLEKIVLYGSRARGDHHSKSDIDLCIFGSGLSAKDIIQIEALARDNTETLLPIDLVHWESLENENLKANIEKDAIVL